MNDRVNIPDEIREIARITGAEAIIYIENKEWKIHVHSDRGKEFTINNEAAKKRQRKHKRGRLRASK